MKNVIPSWLPDWKDESLYPCPETTSKMRWAWEFLRRNPDYQKDYLALQDFNYHKWLSTYFFQDEKAREDGRHSTFFDGLESDMNEYFCFVDYMKQKYHIHLPQFNDPSESEPKNIGFDTQFIKGIPGGKIQTDMKLKDNEYGVVFNLSVPLDEQWKKAKQLLKEVRKLLKIEQVNKIKGLYLRYLRILDAYSCGAKPSEIASILFPSEDDSYETRYIVTDKVKKACKAAKRLRDRDYIVILT